jgi:hypothetical protein
LVNDPELATEPSPAAEMVQEKRKYEKRTTAK